MIAVRLSALLVTVLAGALLNAPVQVALRRLGRTSVADRLQIGLCRVLCVILRLDVRAQGVLPARRPVLVVANHVSWTDILVLGSLAPLCFLAKAEVAHWPLVGWAARAHGTLFVARRRTRQLPAVNRAMAAQMAQGRAVVLFAEGTTGNGTRLDRFRSGHLGAARDLLASEAGLTEVAIVPVALAYNGRAGLIANAGERMRLAWPGDVPLLPHVLTLLREGPVRCEVAWGPPLLLRRDEDRKALMAATRAQVRAAFVRLIAGRRETMVQDPVKGEPRAVWSVQTMAHTPLDSAGPLP